ncbi:hypothetical protein HDU76_011678, partial [Blyttiomyces sp. JEL0837]
NKVNTLYTAWGIGPTAASPSPVPTTSSSSSTASSSSVNEIKQESGIKDKFVGRPSRNHILSFKPSTLAEFREFEKWIYCLANSTDNNYHLKKNPDPQLSCVICGSRKLSNKGATGTYNSKNIQTVSYRCSNLDCKTSTKLHWILDHYEKTNDIKEKPFTTAYNNALTALPTQPHPQPSIPSSPAIPTSSGSKETAVVQCEADFESLLGNFDTLSGPADKDKDLELSQYIAKRKRQKTATEPFTTNPSTPHMLSAKELSGIQQQINALVARADQHDQAEREWRTEISKLSTSILTMQAKITKYELELAAATAEIANKDALITELRAQLSATKGKKTDTGSGAVLAEKVPGV